jgi:hypothetical protein
MYITKPPKRVKIFRYGVNALYPFTIDKFNILIGKPTFFKGNIRAINSNAFKFFFC